METRIAIATAAMLLLAFGVVGFVLLYQRRVIRHHLEIKALREQRQQELLQASIRAGESERRHIAEELHDDVGATLSSIRLFLHRDEDADSTASPTARDAGIHRAKTFLDDAIAKVRSLSHQLQPALLQRLGLDAALKAFADGLSGNGQLSIAYLPHTSLPKLPPDTELAIYRVVQELVANVIRHSTAGLLRLETGGDESGGWHITIVHDGQGLTQEAFDEKLFAPHTIGLKNIVNRMELIRATIRFSHDADGLFRTHFSAGQKD